MRMRLFMPFVCFALAALAGCGSTEPAAAPAEDPVPASAAVPDPGIRAERGEPPAAPDPAAPLTITDTDILDTEEGMYAFACDAWHNGSWTPGKLAEYAAGSKHIGLVGAVDMLASKPAAGRMEMDRMCANVSL